MAMTARGGFNEADEHPFVINGVRHDSGCDLNRARAYQAEQLKCTCGASKRDLLKILETAQLEYSGPRCAGYVADEDAKYLAHLLRSDINGENARHAEVVERERIACMVERLDNTMMDQAKLAAYIRGEETP